MQRPTLQKVSTRVFLNPLSLHCTFKHNGLIRGSCNDHITGLKSYEAHNLSS